MSSNGRTGRPAKVTREDIATAALNIGLDQANIRNVADALGMSVTGLYHHVRTREDLLNLVIDTYSRKFVLDVDDHSSFAEHLKQHARSLFLLFISQPAIIARAVRGGSAPATMPLLIDNLLAKGRKCGFTAAETYQIVSQVMAAAMGAAAAESAALAIAAKGESVISVLSHLAAFDTDNYPVPRDLAHDNHGTVLDRFDTVLVMLDGLRVKYGARLDACG